MLDFGKGSEMTGEKLIRCKKHSTTGADSCPECDKELGRGIFEERTLKIKLSAEVSYLKGIEYTDNGKEVNKYSETDPGWDEELIWIRRILTNHVLMITKILDMEWE
jgi:hypothetical protein